MRVALYSQDGLGLGHLRRTSTIAARLLEVRPDASVLSICDSPADQLFVPTRRFDRLKLPTIVKRSAGVWHAPALGGDVADVLRLRADLLRAALLAFLPDLVLVDHMPHGAMGELVAGLEELRRANPDTRVVLGVRDIIDSPEVVRARWTVEGGYDAIERLYDRVLVYGSRDVYPLDDLYAFSASVRARTRYCGYVVARGAEVGRLAARRSLFPDLDADRPLVAVLGGSGHDAAAMMASAVAAAEGTGWATAIVCGPNMAEDHRRELADTLPAGRGWVLPTVPSTDALLAAADVCVAMAGYNTTTEILASGVRGVLVPRAGPSLEQRTRARLFADRGWVRTVEPDALTPASLRHEVRASLADAPAFDGRRLRVAVRGPDLGGADAAVAAMLDLLDDVDRRSMPAAARA